jgi:hypothetical protein
VDGSSSFKPFIITCFDRASISSSSFRALEEEGREEGRGGKSLKYMWVCLKSIPFSLVKPKVSSPCISIGREGEGPGSAPQVTEEGYRVVSREG